MNEMKHTPGPWGCTEYANNPTLIEINIGNVIHPHFAIDPDAGVGDEDRANALLIAAAPDTAAERDRLRAINADLLAALEAVARLNEGRGSSRNNLCDVAGHARAAIARAREEFNG